MPQNGTTHYDADTRSGGPDELTEDMSRGDLVYVLQNLTFTKRSGIGLVSMDRHVRDYLLRKIQQR
jgi:hypothetical protein